MALRSHPQCLDETNINQSCLFWSFGRYRFFKPHFTGTKQRSKAKQKHYLDTKKVLQFHVFYGKPTKKQDQSAFCGFSIFLNRRLVF
jgi:hypothetical protein